MLAARCSQEAADPGIFHPGNVPSQSQTQPYWDLSTGIFAAVQRSPGTTANDFCSLSQPVPALDDTDPKPSRFSRCSLGEPPSELVSLRWRWSNKWRLATVSFPFGLLYAKADGLQGRHMEMAGWGEPRYPEMMIGSTTLLHQGCTVEKSHGN